MATPQGRLWNDAAPLGLGLGEGIYKTVFYNHDIPNADFF